MCSGARLIEMRPRLQQEFPALYRLVVDLGIDAVPVQTLGAFLEHLAGRATAEKTAAEVRP